ncbi:lipoyl domain-containing protein [Micromonospora sp. PLK6-60]|uniref:biotin/lipoyl-containing protein n=1 Tax=Micromonospora sp. PLK6-60 TaxID=2873383 RepID=UPI001CA679D2|nr:lipoyl domain-containing protein [Micromonospora sp. PLK6-60]MBY8870596.1 lipoyl domain-containing protein [Micromonospora sp. PLK6-60]
MLDALWTIAAPLVGLAVVIASALGARKRHLARAAADTRPWPTLPDGATAVEMPALGEGVTGATVVRLMTHAGDQVQVGDVVAEVSTDKVDTEIPATSSGTVSAVFVHEGDEVPVGFPLLAVSPSAALP